MIPTWGFLHQIGFKLTLSIVMANDLNGGGFAMAMLFDQLHEDNTSECDGDTDDDHFENDYVDYEDANDEEDTLNPVGHQSTNCIDRFVLIVAIAAFTSFGTTSPLK